jgi:hypothetical protein
MRCRRRRRRGNVLVEKQVYQVGERDMEEGG